MLDNVPALSLLQCSNQKVKCWKDSKAAELSAWRCCRGKQALLCKLPLSMPPPGSSAWCCCAYGVLSSKSNAKMMQNLNISRLNRQQT